MKSKFTKLFIVSALFCFLSASVARPFEEKHERNQTQHHLLKGKHKLSHGRSEMIGKTSTRTKARKIHFPSPLNLKGQQQQKRQYIMHPQISLAGNPLRPYMVIRPPPMTQKTIVTTHIPRPPVTLPYNPYLLMHPFFRGAHLSYGDGLDSHMFEGDEEMGK